MIRPVSDLNQKNTTILDFNDDFSIVNPLLFANGGSGRDTDRFIPIAARDWKERSLGLWEDGKPDGEFEKDDGDGAVLGLSARFNFSNQSTIDGDHEDVISNREAIEKIFEQLGLDESKVVTETEVDKRRAVFVAALRSPGTLHVCVVDVCDSDLGIYLPGEKLFFLPGYSDQALDVEIDADGDTGGYHLYLGKLSDGVASWNNFGGNLLSESQVDRYQVSSQDGELEINLPDEVENRRLQTDADYLNSLLPRWDKKNLLAVALSESETLHKRKIAIRQLRELLSNLVIKANRARRFDRVEAMIAVWKDLDDLAESILGDGNTTKSALLSANIRVVENMKGAADTLLRNSSSYYAAIFYDLFGEKLDRARDLRDTKRDISLELTLSARYLLNTALGVR